MSDAVQERQAADVRLVVAAAYKRLSCGVIQLLRIFQERCEVLLAMLESLQMVGGWAEALAPVYRSFGLP